MDYILEGITEALRLLLSLDEATYSAILATLKASSLGMGLAMAVGLPAGFVLGYYDFPGRRVFRAVFDTLLALPTVVVGLLVYALISRSGPLGSLGLLYTISGIAVGQAILSLPIIIALTASAVETQDSRLKPTLLTLGASHAQMAWGSLRENLPGIMAALATAYGRIISEVGISMMLGGNIKWSTRTITTAMALETGKGEFASGLALGLVLLGWAFAVNAALAVFKRRAAK